MTTNETNQLIGRRGQLLVERNKFSIEIIVRDVRTSYGRTELLVSPIHGGTSLLNTGEAWISLERVNLK